MARLSKNEEDSKMNEKWKANVYQNHNKGVGHLISKLINAHLIQYTARDRMNPQALLYHQDTMKLFEYLIDMKMGLIKDDDRLEQ